MASIQMTGMVSGLDTKAIVESMLEVEKSKIDKINQDKQILEWRQEMYREIIGKVRDFTKKYFDPLNKETYIMGSSSLLGLKNTSTIDSSIANINVTGSASTGNFELSMSQIAKPAKVSGSNVLNQTTVRGDLKLSLVVDETNNEITVDGEKIKIDTKLFKNVEELSKEINSKIQSNEKLKDKVKVEINNGELEVVSKVSITDDNSKLKVTVDNVDYDIELSRGNYSAKELASEINSKLKNSVGSDGKKFDNDSVKIEVLDGKIQVTGAKLSTDFQFDSPKISIGDKELVDTNKLIYKKGFVKGENSELVINVRGKDPIILDLSDIDTSGSNEDILKRISEKINENSDIVKSEIKDGKLVFKANTKDQVVISGNAASSIGLGNSLDINIDINKEKMSNILNFDNPDDKKVEFKINGKVFKYDFNSDKEEDRYIGGKNLTIKQVFSDISNKDDVNISYNSISRNFVIESKTTGEEVNIEGEDVNGKFLDSIFGTSQLKAQGQNAIVEFSDSEGNSNTFEFSSNNFNISGINFDIKSFPTESIKVSIINDGDEVVELMKSFVEDYNNIMEELNSKSKERKNYKYKPLTEAQKDEMTEKEIERWEKKAKEGILGNESEIENFMYKLREAIFMPVGNSSISLRDIGFDTSNDYIEGGKINFDETKFRNALTKDSQGIYELFTKASDSGYENYNPNLTNEQRKAQDADQGIFRRVNAVLNDYTRVTRSNSGKKGIFIEKAGVSGDTTFNENVISRAMKEYDKKISRLNDIMTSREERYYRQFTRLETAMAKLQSQSSMFMQ